MTPDTYAVRDSTGRPVAFYDSRDLAQYDTERYPGGTVVGLVGEDEADARAARAVEQERARVVAWLRDLAFLRPNLGTIVAWLADDIDSGEHEGATDEQ